MILTERRKSKELMYLSSLSVRSKLMSEDQWKLEWLSRGFSGEVLYDKMFDDAQISGVFVFRDIFLNIDGGPTQYDNLIVTDVGITVNEVKNYSGNYEFRNKKWHVRGKQISDNPVTQVDRASGKLIKMRNLNRFNFAVEQKIIFMNIDFMLGTDDDSVLGDMVMRNGLKNYLGGFRRATAGEAAMEIVELIKKYIVEEPYFDSSADYDLVRKGFYCRECGSFELEKLSFHFQCLQCGKTDTIHTLLLRAIADYSILFSDRQLTRKGLWEFISRLVSKNTVMKYLKLYCESRKSGPGTYYIFNFHSFEEAYEKFSRKWRYLDK